LVHSLFKHDNGFYRVREGDLFGALKFLQNKAFLPSNCLFDRLRLQCQSVRWSFTKRVIPSSTIIAEVGPEVTETYIDFFTSTIRNRNTRQAYARACWQSFDWCAAHGLELTSVRPFHVAAWIEDFPGSKPTVKQKLAAVRMLYDFLVVRKITPSNPAHAVRGPKYVVKKGKTPVWSREDSKTLLDSILKDSVSGLRDRALIAAMLYSFARVSAVLKLKFDDYYHNGARRRLRLHEKGRKEKELPVHHKLEELLDEYLKATGLGNEPDSRLFPAALGKTGKLSRRPLVRTDAADMLKRRLKQAGLPKHYSPHSFRGDRHHEFSGE
jgi:integrase/recombinase XerD